MGADEFGAESLGPEEHARIMRETRWYEEFNKLSRTKGQSKLTTFNPFNARTEGLCGKADFSCGPIVGTLFEQELCKLINKYSVENALDMPDFILAKMLCCMIEAMGPKIKQTLDWHGCNSVCHPKEE